MKPHSVSAAIVSLVVGLNAAAAAVQLNLRVEPRSDLPALAPTLRLTASNGSDVAAQLPQRLALTVRPEGQPPFFARVAEDSERVIAGHFVSVPLSLQPGHSLDLSFWAGPGAPVWFANDPRLWNPGTYHLQVIADNDLTEAVVGDPEHALEDAVFGDAIVSNEADFIVQEPTGSDAGVWNLIQAGGKTPLWMHDLANEIVARFPTSRYASFVVERAPTDDPSAQIAVFTRAVERNARTWSGDWSKLALSQFKAGEAESLAETGHIDGALVTYRESRNLVEEVARHTHDSRLLKQTAAILASPPVTRKDIERRLAALSPNPPAEVEPFADCAEKAVDGTYTIWFSSSNPTAYTIEIPIGTDNKFTAPPFDRGQGTSFAAGVSFKKFSVTTTAPELTWHLQKSDLHVLVKNLPNCADLIAP